MIESATQAPLDAVSSEWVRVLSGSGPEHDAAVERLHQLLVGVAQNELRRRRGRTGVAGAEADDLAHQAAADAVLAVVRKVGQFRGESRFTTWAYRFVILEVSTKLGRHFWRRRDISLEADGWEGLPDRFGFEPDRRGGGGGVLGGVRGGGRQGA